MLNSISGDKKLQSGNQATYKFHLEFQHIGDQNDGVKVCSRLMKIWLAAVDRTSSKINTASVSRLSLLS